MLIRLLKFWGKLQGPRPLDFQPVCIYANNVPLPKFWPVLKGSVELKNIFNCHCQLSVAENSFEFNSYWLVQVAKLFLFQIVSIKNTRKNT